MTKEEYAFTVIACLYGVIMFVIVCFCLFGLYECIFGTKKNMILKQEEYDFEIFDVNVNDLK